jgi:hypothetical protein
MNEQNCRSPSTIGIIDINVRVYESHNNNDCIPYNLIDLQLKSIICFFAQIILLNLCVECSSPPIIAFQISLCLDFLII